MDELESPPIGAFYTRVDPVIGAGAFLIGNPPWSESMTPTEQLSAAEAAHKGMTMDVRNMLKQAGQCNRNTGCEHDLNQLGKNLAELKARWLAGDEMVIAEFFALYRIDTLTGAQP